MPLLLCGFVMSASKSAFVAAAVLLLFNSLFAGSHRSRITVVSILGIVLLIAAQTLNLSFVLQTLVRSADTYERISNLHSNDGNFVIGRIAGLFIVPRMVAAHPLSGVGWGNYGLLRNLPEYRGASAFTFENDQPALGLLGDAAEFGIPLDLFLLALISCYPSSTSAAFAPPSTSPTSPSSSPSSTSSAASSTSPTPGSPPPSPWASPTPPPSRPEQPS